MIDSSKGRDRDILAALLDRDLAFRTRGLRAPETSPAILAAIGAEQRAGGR